MYALAGYGDATADLQRRIIFLTTQLRIMATSARQAKERGDAAGLQAVVALYRKVSAEAATLRQRANEADQPSAVMLALSDFSDASMAVAKELARDLGKVAGGVASAVGILPLLLVGVLVVVGVGLFKGSIRVRR